MINKSQSNTSTDISLEPLPIVNSSIAITVVIGTYNRAEMLRQTLESLTQLHTEGRFSYEIVVINNASSDHTDRVIEEMNPGSAEACRGFHESQPGVAYARNRGVKEAIGNWVAFHDDDQIADPRWLLELYDLAHRRDARFVGGNVKLLLPEGTSRELAPECRGLLGERHWMKVEKPYGRTEMPGTNNMMVHRDVLKEVELGGVGVFDVSITDGGEDTDLCRRISNAGYQGWYTPDSIVHHIIPAERLSDDYMRWTSIRKGQHVARRELLDFGRCALPFVATARVGQSLLKFLPKHLFARLKRDPEQILATRCPLWRNGGYFRRAIQLMLGRCETNQAGGLSLNLREGREQLTKG